MIDKNYETLVYNLIKPYFEKKYGKGREYKVNISGTIRVEGEECLIKKTKTEFQPLEEIITMYIVYDIYPWITDYGWWEYMMKLRQHIIKNNKCNLCIDGLCIIGPYDTNEKRDICCADMDKKCPNISIVEEYFNG